MDDKAIFSVRHKTKSSLLQAIRDLKEGTIQALVTCSNTGAVTAASVLYLKRFVGLHHPALIATFPTLRNKVVVLDVGAFVTASSRDLIAYAELGSAFASLINTTLTMPKVGLLNIGKEPGRGPDALKEADSRLRQHQHARFAYCGNVEPDDVFSGRIDVVVTSGFAGNIFLKTVEGMAKLFPPLTSSTGGAALLAGVNHLVFKCHGATSAAGVVHAIQQAYEAACSNLLGRLQDSLC